MRDITIQTVYLWDIHVS